MAFPREAKKEIQVDVPCFDRPSMTFDRAHGRIYLGENWEPRKKGNNREKNLKRLRSESGLPSCLQSCVVLALMGRPGLFEQGL